MIIQTVIERAKLLIEPLEIGFRSDGGTDIIYPVLIDNGQRKILVDCGYPSFGLLLENALNSIGSGLAQVTDIIIIHHDVDHVGALFEIYQEHPQIRIHASFPEMLFVDASLKSPRLLQAETLFESLPEDQKSQALAFQSLLESIKPVPVHQMLTEELDSFDGIQILMTPGHSPGHISLYIPEQKTLIAGDAVVYVNGKLDIANPAFAVDLSQAIISVSKIAALDITRLICFHGGVVEAPVSMFSELMHRYNT